MLEPIFPQIDIPTLAVSRGLMQLALGGLLLWMVRRQSEWPGPRWWAAGLALSGLSLLAFPLRLPSLDSLLIAFNHLSLGLASACFLIGFARLGGRPIPRATIAALMLITIVNLLWWEWLQPNARMRILSTAAAQLLYFIALALLLRHPPRSEMAHIYRALRWIVLVYALLFAWSYASIGELLPTTARAGADYHRSVFSLASMLFQLSLAVACLALQFSLLSSRHADAARQDWLTGLLNRRGFVEATRGAETGSLILFDVDHFKTINDRHGHAAGDRVLRCLSEVLKARAEPPRQVARIGGEEFCLWLPGQSADEAETLAETLRVDSAALAVPNGRDSIRFSLSAGVAERRSGEPLEAALDRADAGLYAAKRAGRNRIQRV